LKLYIDFYDPKEVGKEFNISKIPDIYDSIKYCSLIKYIRYDVIHNFKNVSSFYDHPQDIL